MSLDKAAIPKIIDWLNGLTVMETKTLLADWESTYILQRSTGKEMSILIRGEVAFGAIVGEAGRLTALTHAMALAIAAGEMEPTAALGAATPASTPA